MKSTVTFGLLCAASTSTWADASTPLAPVQVTAARAADDQPIPSTSVITRDDIVRLQATSVEQLLRGVAGFNVSNSGGAGQLTSLFLRGTNSNQVLLLVDGVRVGSATSGAAAFEFIPVEQVERIEIVRGPNSSLYGADAVGGVIQIFTRSGRGQAAFRPSFSAGYGSYDSGKVSAGASGQVGRSWYSANYAFQSTGGFNACSGGATFGCFLSGNALQLDKDGFTQHSGSLRLGHRFSEALEIEGHALYTTGQAQFDGAFFNPDFSTTAVDRDNFVQQILGGKLTAHPLPGWALTLTGGESQDRRRTVLEDGRAASTFSTTRSAFTAQNDVTLARNHILTLGYDYLLDRVDSSTRFNQTTRDNHAGFVQYRGELGAHQWQAALRGDHNQQFGDQGTYNAAYALRLPKGWRLSASVGSAFHAPTFNDLYFPPFGPIQTSNPDLRPERSLSYEVGVSRTWQDGRASINAFETNIDNLIALDSDFIPQNLARARIQGLETALHQRLQDWDWKFQLSSLDPRNQTPGSTDGNLLPRRAQTVLRVDADRTFGPWRIGSSLRYEGSRYDDTANRRPLDEFVTVDLRTGYRIQKNWWVEGSATNLLGAKYQTARGYNAPGAGVFLTLRYQP